VLESGVGDVELDDRLAGIRLAVGVDGLAGQGNPLADDRADPRPGHANVLAVDDEVAVVEVGAHDVIGAAATEGPERRQGRHHGDHGKGYRDRSSHGPGGTSDGLHWPISAPSSRNGFEPAIGWVAPPGQRVYTPVWSPAYWADGGIGFSCWVPAL